MTIGRESSHRLPIRYIIALMCCIANILNYGMRMNLSIAILAMVRRSEQESSAFNMSSVPPDSSNTQATVFTWNMQTQQLILGAFYYGYTVSPIIGGWLVSKYGGSIVILTGVVSSSLMMLATPSASEISVGLLILTRIIDGMGQGFVFPATYTIITKWSKLKERSTLISISGAGMSIGAIVASYVSAWLCSNYFLGGWPSTFYLFGICGITWSIGWYIIGSDEPTSNRWISTIERDEILVDQNEEIGSENMYKVPWKRIFKSAPVWSLCAGAFGFNYGYFLLFSDIPIFFETILGFKIETTGLLTTMPHTVMCVTTILGGVIADNFISREILSIAITRKSLACFGLGVPSIFLVAIGYTANNATLAVVLMTAAFGMYGFYIPSVDANAMDIAPNQSGLIIGIMFSLSSCTGFIAPAVLGAITNTNNTVYQWRKVFWIVAAVQTFGLITFLIFGSGEIQDWSKNTDNSDTVGIDGLQDRSENTDNSDIVGIDGLQDRSENDNLDMVESNGTHDWSKTNDSYTVESDDTRLVEE